MAEAAVNPIVDIISRLWTCCARHTKYLCKLQQNMILLRNVMKELKDARSDVQRRVIEAEADLNEPKMRTDSVNGWLQSVEKIEGEVEVILQKSDEQLNRARCLGGCCPPNNCWSNYKLGKSVVSKMASVGELKVSGKFEEVTYRLPPPSVQDMNLESTVGMESMFEKVWRLITSKDHKVSIMGLYGIGGVGKTTLLEKINNELDIMGFDHVVIFVVVSKPINYEDIQKKIGERLRLSLLEGDEKSRAQKIFNELRNKNYVLLLDDIWEKVDKKRIGIPIHPQGNSSKLIFTTRSERVCGLMEATHTFLVECLPWDKAWRLFQDKVGEDALTSFPGARELAKDVAKECGGLPLALITIGRAMSTKKSVQEWRDARKTLQKYASEFEGMSDEVLPRLKLSYDYLHNETEKSCFRYCALFPEDSTIEIAQLVELWIGEGFLDGFEKLDEARDRGHTIIGSLKSACLLESNGEDEDDDDDVIHVKMHDVIRDLALWIVNDCSTNQSNNNNSYNKFLVAGYDPYKKWENAERIFWDATHYPFRSTNNQNENPPTSPNLLTLVVRNMDSVYFCLPQSFFQHMPLLRVLDLSNARWFNPDQFPELPVELQYLNLSWTQIEELPIELRKLAKLKFLVLKNTRQLRKISAGLIASLSELQVLDLGCVVDPIRGSVFEDWELEGGPSLSELDGLKQLQEVQITIRTYVALEKFLCNRKLQMVCTGLYFCSSESSSSSSSSRRALNLCNFKSLKDIHIKGFSELEELVLCGMCGSTTDGGLLSNLETLSLDYLPKLNSILWMVATSDLSRSPFQNLYRIIIISCNALKDLKWLVYAENLVDLSVEDCNGLETIIELGDDHGLEEGGEVFRSLKYVYMERLPKLKSICRHALAFPSIKTIQIVDCPELKKLPLDSGSNINNTLQEICGSPGWYKELQWEDETIKSKFRIYF